MTIMLVQLTLQLGITKRSRRASLSFSATVVKNVSSPRQNNCSISYYVCFPKQGNNFLIRVSWFVQTVPQNRKSIIIDSVEDNQQLILNRQCGTQSKQLTKIQANPSYKCILVAFTELLLNLTVTEKMQHHTAASVLGKGKVSLAQVLHCDIWQTNSNFKFYLIGKYITLIRIKTAKF